MKWRRYQGELWKALDSFEFGWGIIPLLKEAKGRIFIAGNGGSAATAMHYACDFMNHGLNVICLNTNISQITATANDHSYKKIFRKQLENLDVNKKDILILISASGNSPNIISAAKYALNKGLRVIGICGFSGGRLKKISHYSATVYSKSYEICEDIHSMFGHYLTIKLKRCRK